MLYNLEKYFYSIIDMVPKECLDVNDDSEVAVCGYLLGMTVVMQ
ncbi:hypothetical protein [Calditerrivibrio sp.]